MLLDIVIRIPSEYLQYAGLVFFGCVIGMILLIFIYAWLMGDFKILP